MRGIIGVGRDLGAIVVTTLALLAASVFTEVAIEMGDAWWQWAVGLAVAGAIGLGSALVIYLVMRATVEAIAAGWYGMFAGQTPTAYTAEQGNLGRGLGNLMLLAATALAGTWLRARGVASGNGNWAVGGLMLLAAGLVLGLAAAVPRFYFVRARRGASTAATTARRESRGRSARRQARRRDAAASGVATLITASLVGVALAMAATGAIAASRLRDGVAELAYADWAAGCVDRTWDECPTQVVLTLRPRRAVRQRIEYLASCLVELRDDHGATVSRLPDADVRALGVDPGQGPDARRRWLFDPSPGHGYQVRIVPTSEDVCTYAVRFLDEPVARRAP